MSSFQQNLQLTAPTNHETDQHQNFMKQCHLPQQQHQKQYTNLDYLRDIAVQQLALLGSQLVSCSSPSNQSNDSMGLSSPSPTATTVTNRSSSTSKEMSLPYPNRMGTNTDQGNQNSTATTPQVSIRNISPDHQRQQEGERRRKLSASPTMHANTVQTNVPSLKEHTSAQVLQDTSASRILLSSNHTDPGISKTKEEYPLIQDEEQEEDDEQENAISSSNSSRGSTTTTTGKQKKMKFSHETDDLHQRKGKWTLEEEEYAAAIIKHYTSGLLRIPEGVSLRTYLATKLNCDPMRITKKYSAATTFAKKAYHLSDRSRIQFADFDRAHSELMQLEQRFRLRTGVNGLGFSNPVHFEPAMKNVTQNVPVSVTSKTTPSIPTMTSFATVERGVTSTLNGIAVDTGRQMNVLNSPSLATALPTPPTSGSTGINHSLLTSLLLQQLTAQQTMTMVAKEACSVAPQWSSNALSNSVRDYHSLQSLVSSMTNSLPTTSTATPTHYLHASSSERCPNSSSLYALFLQWMAHQRQQQMQQTLQGNFESIIASLYSALQSSSHSNVPSSPFVKEPPRPVPNHTVLSAPSELSTKVLPLMSNVHRNGSLANKLAPDNSKMRVASMDTVNPCIPPPKLKEVAIKIVSSNETPTAPSVSDAAGKVRRKNKKSIGLQKKASENKSSIVSISNDHHIDGNTINMPKSAADAESNSPPLVLDRGSTMTGLAKGASIDITAMKPSNQDQGGHELKSTTSTSNVQVKPKADSETFTEINNDSLLLMGFLNELRKNHEIAMHNAFGTEQVANKGNEDMATDSPHPSESLRKMPIRTVSNLSSRLAGIDNFDRMTSCSSKDESNLSRCWKSNNMKFIWNRDFDGVSSISNDTGSIQGSAKNECTGVSANLSDFTSNEYNESESSSSSDASPSTENRLDRTETGFESVSSDDEGVYKSSLGCFKGPIRKRFSKHLY